MKKSEALLLQLIVVLGATLSGEIAVAADESLPPTQRAGEVTYLSGGIGIDQARAIKDVMRDYSLVLTFVGTTQNGNEYLSDVPVTIADVNGNTVLDTKSDGPFMLASLPKGRYTITASYKGKTEQRTVNISTSQHARQVFTWVM
ncbi:carboxypeptidase-like regulatory domain-containing protein [Paraburkholderia lacunae]|uniref:Carboxypeptidase regulatory-like domain-containing protein n=1 Tax=Paraburkholderia lacunae TaxID=2211104 RepID=A0A370MXQ5_9BURK|nr:carboxypeptidase-like regulatory domain-containing protein [Paraburkholderia lacunae]RDJ98168.1 carboxypeptidase regulatory-like domain-containing protein [Paraburkholderia lacunae]